MSVNLAIQSGVKKQDEEIKDIKDEYNKDIKDEYNKDIKDEYKIDVEISTSYGHYLWCGKRNKGGFVLANSIRDESKPIYDEIKLNRMIHLDILMNKKLFDETSIIEVIDDNGILRQYSRSINKLVNRMFFPLNTETKELRIVCKQLLPFTKPVLLSKAHFKLLTEVKIKVPRLVVVGKNTKCVICKTRLLQRSERSLASAVEDKYISKCGHTFHNSCIYNYTKTRTKKCNFCHHSDKILPFRCPVCDIILENNND